MSQENRSLRLLLKDCANGFYQQMYFLGKDVTHSQGNQLKKFGFERTPSKGLKGTSCYTYESQGGLIELYGSCAGYYSDTIQIVFLRNRCRFYKWIPEDRLVAGCWSQEEITTDTPHKMLSLIIPFLKWWCSYEKWIEDRLGRKYREKCFKEWNRVKGRVEWLPPSVAMEWVQQLIEQKELHIRPKRFC